MSRWFVCMGGAALLGASLSNVALAEETRVWHDELRMEGIFTGVTVDHPASFSAATLTEFAPHLVGTAYLQPLVDDGVTPFALLPFLQHPSTVSLGVRDTFGVSSTTGQSPSGGLSAAVYPWRRTGLLAAASLGTAGPELTTHFEAGVSEYLHPRVRVDALFVGDRSVTAGSGDTDSSTYRSNRVRLAATAVFWHSHLGLTGLAELGREDGGSGAGFRAPVYNVAAGATGYLNRQLSASVGAGLRGARRITGPEDASNEVETRRTPYVQLGLQCFLSGSLYVRGTYEYDSTHAFGTPGLVGESTEHVSIATVSLGGRL